MIHVSLFLENIYCTLSNRYLTLDNITIPSTCLSWPAIGKLRHLISPLTQGVGLFSTMEEERWGELSRDYINGFRENTLSLKTTISPNIYNWIEVCYMYGKCCKILYQLTDLSLCIERRSFWRHFWTLWVLGGLLLRELV